MKSFQLRRMVDPLDISGTGIVAEGVEFTDGTVAMRWKTKHASTTIWASMEQVQAVHCHGGNSVVEWIGEKKDGDATVLEVREGALLSLPSQPYWEVVYAQDGVNYGLCWRSSWGQPPRAGDRIEIELDDIMSPKHAHIVGRASE